MENRGVENTWQEELSEERSLPEFLVYAQRELGLNQDEFRDFMILTVKLFEMGFQPGANNKLLGSFGTPLDDQRRKVPIVCFSKTQTGQFGCVRDRPEPISIINILIGRYSNGEFSCRMDQSIGDSPENVLFCPVLTYSGVNASLVRILEFINWVYQLLFKDWDEEPAPWTVRGFIRSLMGIGQGRGQYQVEVSDPTFWK